MNPIGLIIALFVSNTVSDQVLPFKIKFEWSQIEYEFNSEEERSEAISNGTFDIGNIQPIDAQYYYDRIKQKERVFITIPRFPTQGVASTLNTVTKKTINGNPVLRPYPSWSWQINPEKCNYERIVSVFRVWIDECKRLWVLDTGVVGDAQVCPPQILAFDLSTDKLIIKYEIPPGSVQPIYVTPIVEVERHHNRKFCQDSWVYAADVSGSLLVYSLRQNKSWSFRDKSFDANPAYAVYNVSGDSFEFADGIFALALTPYPAHKKLFFHALAGVSESWVHTRDLKVPVNRSDIYHTFPTTRDEQSAAQAFDSKGNLYFSLLSSIEIVSWNFKNPYEKKYWKVVGNDKITMQFPSGLKVSRGKNNQEQLWVFATALQRWASDNLNPNVTNFRLLYANL